MNYDGGIEYMLNLYEELQDKSTKTSFKVGDLMITYPGYKKPGDYRLSKGGIAPTHVQIVNDVYSLTTPNNFNQIKEALSGLYNNGLECKFTTFDNPMKELIYWITLQEEINYPQTAGFAGRKLCYQRYYEGSLAKLGHITLKQVHLRTNNHKGPIPNLLTIPGIEHPIFYR